MNKLFICLILGAALFVNASETVLVWNKSDTNTVTTITNVVAFRPCKDQRLTCTNIVHIKEGKTNVLHLREHFFQFKVQ